MPSRQTRRSTGEAAGLDLRAEALRRAARLAPLHDQVVLRPPRTERGGRPRRSAGSASAIFCPMAGHPETHTLQPAGGVPRRRLYRRGRLELREAVEVAEDAHLGPLVERLLHLRRERDVLDEELREVEPEFLELLVEPLLEETSEVVVVRGEVEDRDLRAAEDVAEAQRRSVRSWSLISS